MKNIYNCWKSVVEIVPGTFGNKKANINFQTFIGIPYMSEARYKCRIFIVVGQEIIKSDLNS